jgi:metal-responsive CopG/Arc/MetJ family transcriptional regulator
MEVPNNWKRPIEEATKREATLLVNAIKSKTVEQELNSISKLKKILVSLPDGVVETLHDQLIGEIGQTRSEILRTVIMGWLSEKGYPRKAEKSKKANVKRDTNEEIDVLDTMLFSLVELLEAKSAITEQEYEKRVKEKVNIK